MSKCSACQFLNSFRPSRPEHIAEQLKLCHNNQSRSLWRIAKLSKRCQTSPGACHSQDLWDRSVLRWPPLCRPHCPVRALQRRIWLPWNMVCNNIRIKGQNYNFYLETQATSNTFNSFGCEIWPETRYLTYYLLDCGVSFSAGSQWLLD